MRVPVRRRFGLLDVMILVAAMALWLAVTRHLASKTNQRSYWYVGHPRHLIYFVHDLINGLLFLLSSACLLIRLRPPRPARRRLWCQPSFAACAAAVLGG
jgi:hypothetical protein